MTSKCLIKRKLPDAPKPTRPIRDDRFEGYGKMIYERQIPTTTMELMIPPTKSNSKAAEAEREIKAILDLAREGKTASEISAETGFNMNRIKAVVNRFAEYGAKLASEKKPKRRKAPKPLKDKRSSPRFWTDERTRVLINQGADQPARPRRYL